MEPEKSKPTGRVEGASRFPPGTRVGPYEVVKVLGRGAMGLVLQAKHVELGREVALKVLAQVLYDDSAERFRREAEAVARLEHPGIVRVYERGETDGTSWYAMELVRGASLDVVIKRDRPSYVEAAKIVARVAHAIDFAHSQGVIHRDLKPANILLDERGEPHVTDFGLARMDTKATLTTEGTIVGTPLYLPPEVARGDRATRRADVYSLGATLYELATGRPPYEGREAQTILAKILDGPPTSPREVDPRLPADLVTIIGKAMMREPDERYASPRLLAVELERFAQERPLQLSGRGGGAFHESALQRNLKRGALAAAIALFLLFVGWRVVDSDRRRREAERRQRETARKLAELERGSVKTTVGPSTLDLDAAQRARDRDARAREEASRLKAPPDPTTTAEARRLIEQARRSLADNLPTEASNRLRSALSAAPTDPDVLLAAASLLPPDEAELAERTLSVVVELSDDAPGRRAAARLARAQLYRQRDEEVWRYLADVDLRVAWATSDWPGRVRAGAELALAHARAGQAVAARKLLPELGSAAGDDLAVLRVAEALTLKLEQAPQEQVRDALDRAAAAATSNGARDLVDRAAESLGIGR